MTALHWAAFHGRTGHVRLLLEKKADLLSRDTAGKLPLHWAAQVLQPFTYNLLHLTSVCKFSILFNFYFLWCLPGESVWQIKASQIGDHFLLLTCTIDFKVIQKGEIRTHSLLRVQWLISKMNRLACNLILTTPSQTGTFCNWILLNVFIIALFLQ